VKASSWLRVVSGGFWLRPLAQGQTAAARSKSAVRSPYARPGRRLRSAFALPEERERADVFTGLFLLVLSMRLEGDPRRLVCAREEK